MRLLLLLFGCLSLFGGVKINEVMFWPDPASEDPVRNHAWIELVNDGEGPVDVAGWVVARADGASGPSARPLPALVIPPGGYLVVHFATGADRLNFDQGWADVYTNDAAEAGYWNTTADEAALYSPDGIVDFLNWSRFGLALAPGPSYEAAVAAGIWRAGAVILHDRIGASQLQMLRQVVAGDSLGRDSLSTDTDSPQDFDAGGGPSGLGPTPGRQNLTESPVEQTSEAAPQAVGRPGPRAADPVRRKWTVLLYMSSDNNLESWFFKKLRRLQQSLAASDDVAFVTQWDAKTINRTTYRFRVSTPRDDEKLGAVTPPGQNADVGERNMADPRELREFVEWAKTNYPAEHYGLILSGHGDGWKGYGPDETFPEGTREKSDSLTMGELSTALAGQRFAWIVFDACLMSGVEVAYQLQPFSDYLLASEEVTYTTDFPYESMGSALVGNPGVSEESLAYFLFDEMSARQKLNPGDRWELALVDLRQIRPLAVNLRAWADLLAPGMSLLQVRDSPQDNAQVLTAGARRAAEKFTDENFIDLHHFTELMRASGVPACLLTPTQSILQQIRGRAVLKEGHGAGLPNARGLHIYFPLFRMYRNITRQHLFPNWESQPYDLPSTRTFSGSTPLAHYGVRQDALPLKERDPETDQDFDIAAWPLPQSPDFPFPNDTGWHKVLDRFYHPAADNKILKAIAPDGSTILPTTSGGGACANSSDSITAPVGSTVYFSGSGSSDADMPGGAANIRPLYYFWDMDDSKNCAGCPEPHGVPPGADAGTAASNNMDADRTLADSPMDDKDASGPNPTRVCTVPGRFLITLMPWDDNHLMPFHDTLPSAAYVHPQSGLHTSEVNCTAAPPPSICTNGDFYTDFRIVTDPAGHNPFIGLTTSTRLLQISISGTSVTVTGNHTAIARLTGTVDPSTCTFNAEGLNTVAGFPNILTRFKNARISASGGTRMIFGTYTAGEDGRLPQAQAATYSMAGSTK